MYYLLFEWARQIIKKCPDIVVSLGTNNNQREASECQKSKCSDGKSWFGTEIGGGAHISMILMIPGEANFRNWFSYYRTS